MNHKKEYICVSNLPRVSAALQVRYISKCNAIEFNSIQFQFITSLLLYFTKICIHKLTSMIQLNTVIQSAYTCICNPRQCTTIEWKTLWAPCLLQYYDHIHQNKKHTCHLRMWDWFYIIHQILISSHFIEFNTLRAERWNIWLIFVPMSNRP